MTSRSGPRLRRVFIWLAAILAVPAHAAETLNIGFYMPGIRDANQADVKVFLQLWADEVAMPHGINVTALTYDDMNALYRDSQRGVVNMVIAPGLEMAETFTPGQLATGFISHRRDSPDGVAIIVRADSGIQRFTDLRGKKVLRLANDRLGRVYLEIQCRKQARSSCAEMLNVAEEKRDTQLIHKVFFGQTDAALVSLTALHAAGEMNPQVRQRLRAIDEWKSPAASFGMMLTATNADLRNRVLSAALGIQTSARGKQILELFKVDYMERTDAKDLEPYWQLHREYHELTSNPPKKQP
jgi:ABC-type phosphate/phosphonate transport system substrate-binding protein